MIVRPSLKNKRNLLFGNLIKSLALVSYNLDNKDGFGVLMENNITHRTLDFEEYLKVLKGIKPQKIVMHLRKATVGKVCQRNIHLWNEDGFIIAHNGSVGGFYYDMEKKETDSLLFFRKYKDLFKEIFLSKDEKLIEKLISKVKEEILKGVYYVRDTYNELEMILSTDKFYIGKISFSLFRESYFILSSKKDVLEDLKKKDIDTKSFELYLDTIIINMHTKAKKYKQSIYFDDENLRDMIFKGYTVVYKIDIQKDNIRIADIFNQNKR